MEDSPRTLLEFEERFADERACVEYLLKLRWPNGFICPRCGSRRSSLTRRTLYHCRDCGLQTSVLARTVFQDTKKPLRLRFRAMWHLTNQKYGANALGLQRVMGFNRYRTSWAWLHKLRQAMVRPGRDRLSGTIEVDETYIGGERPGKRDRGAAGKALVATAAQQDHNRIGRVRLGRVKDASGESLGGFVAAAVEPGSTVHTDQGAVHPSYLDYYLDEYTFRFNRCTSRSRGKLFYRLAQQAVLTDPLPVKDISSGRKG